MSNLRDSYTGVTDGDDVYTACAVTALKGVKDQYFTDYPALWWLKNTGSIIREDGGERLKEFLEYDENSTFGWYSGNDAIDITPQETLTVAYYKWRYNAVTVQINFEEERQNAGKHKIIPLIEHRIKNARKTCDKQVNSALFNTAPTGKAINSLEEIIDSSDPGRGSLGDIARATYSWWQANETASGSFAAQGLSDIRTMHTTCGSSAGKNSPTFSITTSTIYDYYENDLQPQARYSDSKTLDGGFDNIKFRGMVIAYDDACLTGRMYFLNHEYIKLVIDSGADSKLFPFVKPANQTNRTAQIVSGMQIIPIRCDRLGKLTGITA